jgi:hypothetical protein
MRRLSLIIAAAVLLPGLAVAAATVPLPRDRPADTASSSSSSMPLPRERPSTLDASSASLPAPAPLSASSAISSPSPSAQEESMPASSAPASMPPASIETAPPPPRDYQVACPSVMAGAVTAKSLPPIHEGECGIQSPLSVSAVEANGRSIPLTVPVTTDCGMATALPAWVGEVDSYVAAHDNTRLAKIAIGANYECRNVDHETVGPLSFHSFADALDVLAFTLADGRTVDLKSAWRGTPAQGTDIWHYAHDAACSHFMTVLGPDADAFHQDNLHIDLACHGKMCTARVCQ